MIESVPTSCYIQHGTVHCLGVSLRVPHGAESESQHEDEQTHHDDRWRFPHRPCEIYNTFRYQSLQIFLDDKWSDTFHLISFPHSILKKYSWLYRVQGWSGKNTVADLGFLGGTNPRVDCTNYLWQTFLPKTAWKWKKLKREGLEPPLKWPPLASPTQFLEPLLYCCCPLIHWPLSSTFANPPVWWFSSSHNNGMSVRI